MTAYFLDSSALAKRYVQEPGSSWINALFTEPPSNTIFIAEITLVELAAAMARRVRQGTLTDRQWHDFYVLLMVDHIRGYEIVALDRSGIQSAMELSLKAGLRAYDAVQLWSGILAQGKLRANDLPPLTFVSSDKDLLQAAAAPEYQFQIVDPNTL